jgi:hypothetical protein
MRAWALGDITAPLSDTVPRDGYVREAPQFPQLERAGGASVQ